jgi:hypothetical protein
LHKPDVKELKKGSDIYERDEALQNNNGELLKKKQESVPS